MGVGRLEPDSRGSRGMGSGRSWQPADPLTRPPGRAAPPARAATRGLPDAVQGGDAVAGDDGVAELLALLVLAHLHLEAEQPLEHALGCRPRPPPPLHRVAQACIGGKHARTRRRPSRARSSPRSRTSSPACGPEIALLARLDERQQATLAEPLHQVRGRRQRRKPAGRAALDPHLDGREVRAHQRAHVLAQPRHAARTGARG